MNLKTRIQALSQLSLKLKDFIEDENSNERLRTAIEKASHRNPWFVKEFELQAIKNIIPWLESNELEKWTSNYDCDIPSAKIGIIMAGNIPLVGFHDFLSTIICGHHAIIKMSGKDKQLLPAIIDSLIEIEPRFKEKISLADKLPNNIEALIATGSNNTARYFEYSYKNIPKIIRKNRSSVAILNGNETNKDYELLAKDICMYFGLGCRNISKIYIPNIEVLESLKIALKNFNWILQNSFYASNLKFQKARLRTIEKSFISADNILFIENEELHSPVSVVNFEVYDNLNNVEKKLQFLNENIQCIVGKKVKKALPLGSTQEPDLHDYADNIDTMKFLTSLQKGA